MRVIGILLIVVALAIAIVPSFTNCSSQGLAIQLPGGKTVPMKCYWTAQASLPVGISLGVVGLLLALSKRRETQLFLSITAGVISAFAALLPTSLIGVCAMQKLCETVERPTLMFAGLIGVGLSIAGIVIALRRSDDSASGDQSTPIAGAAA